MTFLFGGGVGRAFGGVTAVFLFVACGSGESAVAATFLFVAASGEGAGGGSGGAVVVGTLLFKADGNEAVAVAEPTFLFTSCGGREKGVFLLIRPGGKVGTFLFIEGGGGEIELHRGGGGVWRDIGVSRARTGMGSENTGAASGAGSNSSWRRRCC